MPVAARKINTIGVISDTHGLIRPEALEALQGADLIIHAGDIGAPEVLAALRSITEVAAIKGNNDRGPWARSIPDTAEVKAGRAAIFIIHNVHDLNFDPRAAGYRVVISGHSHAPSVKEKDGVVYLNPGSAGPRRFKLPIAVAKLIISGTSIEAKIIELEATAARAKKSLTSRNTRHIKNSAF
jgi:putative phosphoesterase